MLKELFHQLKIGFLALLVFTLITGGLYPLLVTLVAQIIFPWQANGSMVELNGKALGSVLIGQNFTQAKYFWGRPSASANYPYNGASSAGSNSGPSNPEFLKLVQERVKNLQESNADKNQLIPVDLVTASGSGLDPEISPKAALYQVPRIAKERGLAEEVLQRLISQHTKARSFYVLGEPRVNVLQLNLALDSL
jgi:K+-transporting ATPase ATPase C chain